MTELIVHGISASSWFCEVNWAVPFNVVRPRSLYMTPDGRRPSARPAFHERADGSLLADIVRCRVWARVSWRGPIGQPGMTEDAHRGYSILRLSVEGASATAMHNHGVDVREGNARKRASYRGRGLSSWHLKQPVEVVCPI